MTKNRETFFPHIECPIHIFFISLSYSLPNISSRDNARIGNKMTIFSLFLFHDAYCEEMYLRFLIETGFLPRFFTPCYWHAFALLAHCLFFCPVLFNDCPSGRQTDLLALAGWYMVLLSSLSLPSPD